MDDTNQSDKNQKMVLKSIAKWLVIFALIAFVCYKNQDLMQEALEEIQITPVWKLVVCLLLGNLYFIAEGCIRCWIKRRFPSTICRNKGASYGKISDCF